ncbi:MAG: Crp/Fnr family transcriptional regulator [Gammaproteobacteria bacterium]|nr:Crp/Fnr family transcriptional regulator [Gammaproteobacteria bacterium]
MSCLPQESDVVEYLKSLFLFEGVDDELLRQFAHRVIVRQYRKNTIIINQDDETDSIYFIYAGKVRVYRSDERGQEITLSLLSERQYFGEFALLSKAPRSAHVAVMEGTVAITATKKVFMKFFGNNAKVAWKVSEILTNKIRASTLNVSNLALLDVYNRVSKTLLEQASEVDGQLIVEGLTHQDIATMIGASREMVNRIMRDMCMGDYLKTEGRKIILLKDLSA